MDERKESQLRGAAGRSQLPWRLGGALALVCGAVLRLWMMRAIPQVEGDTLLYGNLAKSLVLHGQFAIADGSGVLHETLLRRAAGQH